MRMSAIGIAKSNLTLMTSRSKQATHTLSKIRGKYIPCTEFSPSELIKSNHPMSHIPLGHTFAS